MQISASIGVACFPVDGAIAGDTLGCIEIDNNAAERALRCVALGRKNYLFAGWDAGGDRAAAIYSLSGTAKLNGHNLEAFLREVIARIADHPIARINELLPWHLQPTTTIALAGKDAAPQLAPPVWPPLSRRGLFAVKTASRRRLLYNEGGVALTDIFRQSNGGRILVVDSEERSMASRTCAGAVKLAPLRARRRRMLNQHSI